MSAGFHHHPVIGVEDLGDHWLVKLPLQNSNKLYRQCPYCKKLYPERYDVKNPSARVLNSGKRYGTKQLMMLWAYNNFQKHLKACKDKIKLPQA